MGIDSSYDERGAISPDRSPLPQGASAFADPTNSGLTGNYHRSAAGTELPEGSSVTSDGQDILAGSLRPATHYTIHVTQMMTTTQLSEQFLSLPWEYGGKI
jgi:hypothetical protein